jgi:hypothetical protein
MNQTNDPPHTPLTPAELQELEQLHSKANPVLREVMIAYRDAPSARKEDRQK